MDYIIKVHYIFANKLDLNLAVLLWGAMKLEIEVTARLISEFERTLERPNQIDKRRESLSTF